MLSATMLEAIPNGHASRDLDGDQYEPDTHAERVPVSNGASAEVDQGSRDLQSTDVDPADALLLIQADRLDDIERTRIANGNRVQKRKRNSPSSWRCSKVLSVRRRVHLRRR
jgi:hypothetical protein